MTAPRDVQLTLSRREGQPGSVRRHQEPITVGLPFPRNAVSDSNEITLANSRSTPCPLQARVLDRWPDGSVRWALLDFQADVESSDATYHVHVERGAKRASPPASALRFTGMGGGGIRVATGVRDFVLMPGRGPLVNVDASTDVADGGATTMRLIVGYPNGETREARIDRVTVEEPGALRTTVRLDGVIEAASNSQTAMEVIARVHVFAGSPTLRVSITLRNPQRARHPAGRWDLGDEGSVLVRDVALTVEGGGTAAGSVIYSAELDAPMTAVHGPFELYQDSSGGAAWQSANHLSRDRRVDLAFSGYRVRTGAGESGGARATPIVVAGAGGRTVAVAVPEFWQNFPKAIEAHPGQIVVRLWPRQSLQPHELQGGEQKTHTCFIAFGQDGVSEMPLDWTRAPLHATAAPVWYSASGAVPYLLPIAGDSNAPYEHLVRAAVDGPDTFVAKREVIDEYGWRHFGEIYGDHEAVGHTGAAPLVSHYNNQYDAVAGLAYQFMRSGDTRWWTLMHDLARHVVDIDVYHTDRDKSAYNHGLFWHTVHYVDADTATHRSYPGAARLFGGGPSAEHNYATGLKLHYFLTGDAESRDTAIGLARFVLDIDDGGRTIFRWLRGGATGLASASGSAAYHGPGRGGANSIAALLDGHQLTGERRFLDHAELLIRRCIHPADDIERRDLLDAERKWFYTMFLQSLGRYLDYKISLGERDRMYAYARASLLHYASWMVEREYPYLDKPERLQFPTETWAAQDMRKSEVFSYAARHAIGQAKDMLRERSDFFFNYATTALMARPTRSLARPVVVLLSCGFMHAYDQRHAEASAPLPSWEGGFGEPETFVPQKALAIERAKAMASAAVAASLVAVAWLFAR
jgi:hypothetical protein